MPINPPMLHPALRKLRDTIRQQFDPAKPLVADNVYIVALLPSEWRDVAASIDNTARALDTALELVNRMRD